MTQCIRKFKNFKKSKAILLSCLVFICINSYSQKLKIISIKGSPNVDVFAIKDNIYFLGVSDVNGYLQYPSSFEGDIVVLKKLGYRDTSIMLTNGNQIQMHLKNFQLAEVEISEPRIDPSEILKQFVAYNIPLMSQKRDTILMNFTTTITLPTKDWQEIRSGTIMLVYNSYNKKATGVWNSTYCDLEVKVDSSFWYSPIKSELVRGIIFGVFESEGMRNKRLLRNKFEKEFKIYKNEETSSFGYKIYFQKNKRSILSEAGFKKDSSISYFSHSWVNTANESIKADVRQAKLISHFSYFKYSNEVAISLDSIYSRVGFISKSGIPHEFVLKAKQIEADDCSDLSIFLSFNPEVFKNLGIEEKVKYLE